MYYLLDPPVTPCSPPQEIELWISELKRLEQTPEVKVELERAIGWLECSEKMHNQMNNK